MLMTLTRVENLKVIFLQGAVFVRCDGYSRLYKGSPKQIRAAVSDFSELLMGRKVDTFFPEEGFIILERQYPSPYEDIWGCSRVWAFLEMPLPQKLDLIASFLSSNQRYFFLELGLFGSVPREVIFTD